MIKKPMLYTFMFLGSIAANINSMELNKAYDHIIEVNNKIYQNIDKISMNPGNYYQARQDKIEHKKKRKKAKINARMTSRAYAQMKKKSQQK